MRAVRGKPRALACEASGTRRIEYAYDMLNTMRLCVLAVTLAGSAQAAWTTLPPESGSRMRFFVEDTLAPELLHLRAQNAIGDDVLTITTMYDDMSYACTKLTYLGSVNGSVILRERKLSGQMRPSDLLYDSVKQAYGNKGKDWQKYLPVELACSDFRNESAKITENTYYIPLSKETASFVLSQYWNRASMSLEMSTRNVLYADFLITQR